MTTRQELIRTFKAQIKALEDTAERLSNADEINSLEGTAELFSNVDKIKAFIRTFEEQLIALAEKKSAIDCVLEDMYKVTLHHSRDLTGELDSPKWEAYTERVKSILHKNDAFATLEEGSHDWMILVMVAAIDGMIPR